MSKPGNLVDGVIGLTYLPRMELYRWAYGRITKMSAYHKREEAKEEVKGHNHPFKEKCGPHCPRNEHYKGPARKPTFTSKRKRQ